MNFTDREDHITCPTDAPFAGCGVLMRQKTLRESSMVDLAPRRPTPQSITRTGNRPRHDLHPRRHVPHGVGPALSRGSPGASRYRRRLLDRPHAGHQPRVPQVRQRDRPRHLRGDQAEGGGLSRRAAAHAESRLARVHAAEASGRHARLEPVVELQVRRRLAQALWAALLDQRARRSSGRAHRLSRRRGLRGMGRQGAADRSRVGVRGARRARRRRVRLGRSVHARRQAHGEHLARARSRTRIFRPTATRAPRR